MADDAGVVSKVCMLHNGGSMRLTKDYGSAKVKTIPEKGVVLILEEGVDETGTQIRIRDLEGKIGWVAKGEVGLRMMNSAKDVLEVWQEAERLVRVMRKQANRNDQRDWEIRNELASAEELRRTASVAADEALAVRDELEREGQQFQLELQLAAHARTKDDHSWHAKLQQLQRELQNSRELANRDVRRAAELRAQAVQEHQVAAVSSHEARSAARDARKACQEATYERGELEAVVQQVMLDLREVDAAGAASRAFEQAEDLGLRLRLEEEQQAGVDARREVERLRRELHDLTRLNKYRPLPVPQIQFGVPS